MSNIHRISFILKSLHRMHSAHSVSCKVIIQQKCEIYTLFYVQFWQNSDRKNQIALEFISLRIPLPYAPLIKFRPEKLMEWHYIAIFVLYFNLLHFTISFHNFSCQNFVRNPSWNSAHKNSQVHLTTQKREYFLTDQSS